MRFLQKTGTFRIVRVQTMGQRFQRNGTFELGVFGLMNHAHVSATELLEKLIVGDFLADQRLSILVFCVEKWGLETLFLQWLVQLVKESGKCFDQRCNN